MRNLCLAASTSLELPDIQISCSTTDLDQNIDYIASERCNADADVEVEIYKAERDNSQDPKVSLFSMFTSTARIPIAGSQVISVRVLLDTQQLVAVMAGGDITVIPLDEGPSDVVGTVDGGILAASWSSDDSTLALVTGDEKLILMTSTFEVLSEAPLHISGFGEDAPINVGWGSKQTQFHGSVGKAAASAPTRFKHTVSPDDDLAPRISWRGDGAYFSVSSISKDSFRTFRVYDRQAVLQTTSEDVPGLEHSLAWRPSGNLIASTQRFGYEGGGAGKEGRHDIVFFERNGLRHGEFGIRVPDLELGRKGNLRWGYKVKELRWSSDSNVLAVWMRREDGDLVQLWTIGNYHWYLKQEIAAPASSLRFTSVEWHSEKALSLIMTTHTQLIQRTYAWETCSSPTAPPNDSGSVCVIDGSNLLLTPFRTQNVPPPMSSYQLSVQSVVIPSYSSRIPVHTSFAEHADIVAILWESGHVETHSLNTRLGPGRGKAMQPALLRSFDVPADLGLSVRQVSFLDASKILLLGSREQGSDLLVIADATDEKETTFNTVSLPSRNGHLIAAGPSMTWQSLAGEIFTIDTTSQTTRSVARFTSPCWNTRSVVLEDGVLLFLGYSDSGKMFISSGPDATSLVVANATSFTVASGFLIFTTGAHEALFAPLHSLLAYIQNEEEQDTIKASWEKRRVERGSRIVVPVPSAMSLVLQMPRGNLETINPRPLVMEVVKQDLDQCQFRKAFTACRKHRIDLSVLVEHNREAFLSNVSVFVDQVYEVDHINLFLANVGRSSQSPETIALICDAVRQELEKRDLTNYVNSILTAHVVKTPPDHEAGLSLLLKLRDDNPHLVEDAVKYIIFLVDADQLYNTALGMYDFSLVLMIAQHAQKDPREYLPFLRELRAMKQYIQRYHIDDHLKRYDSGLRNLRLAGDEHFDEAISYIERHQLYETALSIWRDTLQYHTVLSVYGDWLFERREFRQAASVFVEASALAKAMVAFEKALDWQCLFDLAIKTEMTDKDIEATAYRIAEDLTAKKRHPEAARVLLDYTSDVREAVVILTQGNAFSEARRVATLKRKPELLEEVIHPGALDSRAQISEDLNEMREQLQKQFDRLLELRIKRVEEPDAFFGVEDTTLQNVDVMTDVSMPYTAFTRYTIAPTATSRASSKRSSRSKRKQERKVGSGRKGTVDEEEYLVKSIAKLVGRFTTCRNEARALIPHLFQFTAEHRTEGLALQEEIGTFERRLSDTVDEIWKKPTEGPDGSDEPKDSWAARMEQAEKAKRLNPIDSVPKPDLDGKAEWRLRLLDLDS